MIVGLPKRNLFQIQSLLVMDDLIIRSVDFSKRHTKKMEGVTDCSDDG